MTRYEKAFRVVSALACAGLLSGARIACSEDGSSSRGGVLLYAGFDQSKDADYAVGSPTARFHEGGGTLNADGLGFRGSALRSGDGEGYVEYSAQDNINPREGTIEFWMYAQDWDHDDGNFHRFINVRGEGEILFYLRPPGAGEFVIRSISKTANRAYGSNPLKGRWNWYAMTWKPGQDLGFYIGGIKASGEAWSHDCSAASGPLPEPEKLRYIYISAISAETRHARHTR